MASSMEHFLLQMVSIELTRTLHTLEDSHRTRTLNEAAKISKIRSGIPFAIDFNAVCLDRRLSRVTVRQHTTVRGQSLYIRPQC